MTIKEVFFNSEGKEVSARILKPDSDITLGYRTPIGRAPYDESMVVQDPNTIEVLRETIITRDNIREERFPLQGQAINDAALTRQVDTNRISHIVWEESKP